MIRKEKEIPLLERIYRDRSYEVSAVKIREFVTALQPAVVLPQPGSLPMTPNSFALVFSLPVILQVLHDPSLQLNLVKLVHREQKFNYIRHVFPGDVIETTARILQFRQVAHGDSGIRVLEIETESINDRQLLVCRGRWIFMAAE